jgi:tetratricopeptide (TPR) repeat protein
MKRSSTPRLLILATLTLLATPAGQADDETEAIVKRADDEFTAGRFDTAAKAYAEVLARDADSYQATLRLGKIALFRNEFADAEKHLLQAGKLRPDEEQPKALLAELCVRQDRFAQAARLHHAIEHEAVADKLASFRGLTPYETVGAAATARIAFVQTDPLPIIKARINGGDETHLLIDTGAAELYLDPAFAKSIGAPTFGSTEGVYAGGMRAATGHGRIDSLQLGDLTIKNVPVLLLPTRRIPFGPPGATIDGILGTAVLYHFFATLDYPGGELVLRQRTDAARAELDRIARLPATHVVPFWMAGSHLMVAWGRVNDAGPFLFFADTGMAGGGFGCPDSTLEAAGIDLTGLPSFQGIGGGGPVTVTPFKIERLALGDAVQTNVQGMAGAFPMEVTGSRGFSIGGIISHGFFRPYALTFDFEKMRLLLSTPE